MQNMTTADTSSIFSLFRPFGHGHHYFNRSLSIIAFRLMDKPPPTEAWPQKKGFTNMVQPQNVHVPTCDDRFNLQLPQPSWKQMPIKMVLSQRRHGQLCSIFQRFSVEWRRLQEFKDFVAKASSSSTFLGTQQSQQLVILLIEKSCTTWDV